MRMQDHRRIPCPSLFNLQMKDPDRYRRPPGPEFSRPWSDEYTLEVVTLVRMKVEAGRLVRNLTNMGAVPDEIAEARDIYEYAKERLDLRMHNWFPITKGH
jgi:hypothetical protein